MSQSPTVQSLSSSSLELLPTRYYDTFVFTIPVREQDQDPVQQDLEEQEKHQQKQDQDQNQDLLKEQKKRRHDVEECLKRHVFATDYWISRLFPFGGYNNTGRKRIKGSEGQVSAVYVAKWTYNTNNSGPRTKTIRYEIVETSEHSILLFYTPPTEDTLSFQYPPIQTKTIIAADGRHRTVQGIPIRLSWSWSKSNSPISSRIISSPDPTEDYVAVVEEEKQQHNRTTTTTTTTTTALPTTTLKLTMILEEPKIRIRWCNFVTIMTLGLGICPLYDERRREQQHRDEQHEALQRYFASLSVATFAQR